MDDDEHLAFAVLAVCDALDAGATDAGARIAAVETARKHAHAVLNRGKKQTDNAGEEPEGETE